jgi:hypothetical protein
MFKKIVFVVVTLLLSSSNALAIHVPHNSMHLPNNIMGIIGNVSPTHYGILLPLLHTQHTQDVSSAWVAMQINRAIHGHGIDPIGPGGIIGHHSMGPSLIIGGHLSPYLGIQTSIIQHRLGIGF